MATNNSLPIGGFGLNGSGNPNALTNQGLMGGLNKIASGVAGGISGLAGQAFNGVSNYAQNALAGGIKTATGQLSQVNSGQPMTATGTTPGLAKKTLPAVKTPANTNVDNQNNQKGGGSSVDNSAANLAAAHQAQIDSTTAQLKTAQGLLKTAQDKEASAVASYPAGTTPQKDANGDTIPYVAPTQNQQAVGGLLGIETNNNPILSADTQAIQNAELPYQYLSKEQTGGVVGGAAGPESGVIGMQSQFALAALNTAQEKYANDLQEQSQQTTAGNEAASQSAPVQVAPANTFTNPQTGQPIGGGTAGALPASAQTAVNGLIDNVKNGVISYQDAVSQLSSYGPNAVNALLPAIQAKYPGFNVNQANAQSSAQESNTTLAGTTNALIDKANGALSNLPALFDALSPLQQTGSGWIGDTVNGLSTGSGIGATATNAYNAQLNEARAAVNAVLNSAINLGVQTGGATANSLLPDNMSKASLTKNTEVIQNLMQQTKDALAKLSNASPTSGSSGSNAFGNTFPTS
jgi:hypothetical protein